MIRMTQILCPIDFSEVSQHAVDHAAALAHRYGARLTLLHVFPILPAVEAPPMTLGDTDRERLTEAARRVAARVPADVPLEVCVREAGQVHDEIVAQAAETQADLLVIGTHGRSGVQHLFLGSVTEKVIRKAACPTLVVPPRAPDVPADAPVQFHRILCAIDFSDSSLRALAYALNVAGEANARLTLLHVVEIPPELREQVTAPDFDVDRVRAAAEAEARRRLRDLIPADAHTYCSFETAVAEGSAYREVLRHAAEQSSDLMVMGVHGRGALDLLVFGSTTHQVIRAARCPVLIVRHA